MLVEDLHEYNEVIWAEYNRVLAERLPPGQIEDRADRQQALQPEIQWYQNHVDHFMDHLGMEGKDRKVVKDMIRPVLKLVRISFSFFICNMLKHNRANVSSMSQAIISWAS